MDKERIIETLNTLDGKTALLTLLNDAKKEYWGDKAYPFELRQITFYSNPASDVKATPWTVVYQAPPSMGFSRQEYWSGVPLPSPRLNKIIYVK